MAWSIGNENGVGKDSQVVFDLVKKLDPTRPAFVSQANPDSVKGQEWEDDHYPTPKDVDRLAANTRFGANFSENPHIFYQKDTQDYDPGASDLWSEALIKVWDKIWQSPNLLGSFIWEWQNQGIAVKDPNKRDLWYGPDRLPQENDKGVVDSYRNPKAEYWIVKQVYSPVVVGTRTISPTQGEVSVPLTNHYSFTNLNELSCNWSEYAGSTLLKSGVYRIPCAPLQSTRAAFPAPSGMTRLRLDFRHADGTSVVAANLDVTGSAQPAPPASLAGGNTLITADAYDTLTVSNNLQTIVFDKHDGTIRSWKVRGNQILVGGPIVNLGQAKNGGEKHYFYSAKAPAIRNAQVTAGPADALGVVTVTVFADVLDGENGPPLGTLTNVYFIRPDAQIGVQWGLNWSGTDVNLWEEGLKFELPAQTTKMNWLRDSYFADYPVGHIGEPDGVASATDVSFRASKRGLHWLTLTDQSGDGVALIQNGDAPLVGRANASTGNITLFASSEVAGPHDFSGPWVADHDIQATSKSPLTGSFVLRAVVP